MESEIAFLQPMRPTVLMDSLQVFYFLIEQDNKYIAETPYTFE
jgi:hypothetical protein